MGETIPLFDLQPEDKFFQDARHVDCRGRMLIVEGRENYSSSFLAHIELGRDGCIGECGCAAPQVEHTHVRLQECGPVLSMTLHMARSKLMSAVVEPTMA